MEMVLLGVLIAGQLLLALLLWRRSGPTGTGDSRDFERLEKVLKDELGRSRREAGDSSRTAREELQKSLKLFGDSLDKRMQALGGTVEQRMVNIQRDNAAQLEKMRLTVDEKLQSTLEKRLSESFKMVSDRLELVHKGLGEMQTLAVGVGDLKKVLTNVKTRGTWGEIQLDSLLEQIMTPEQYERSVQVKKGSLERVDFAIKIPSRDEDGTNVWLPIDAKFPIEDYQRLVAASEAADPEALALAGKALEARVKAEAKTIQEKYVNPPHTTNFAILYLPTEGLYAEVTQRAELCDLLQRQYRVSVAGPNTIAALLNSLQMGFRTLAIQQRTSEVWQVLGIVKTEFGRFGDLLDKTKKKLQEATNTIEDASSKSRNLERKLGRVERLAEPTEQTALLPGEDE